MLKYNVTIRLKIITFEKSGSLLISVRSSIFLSLFLISALSCKSESIFFSNDSNLLINRLIESVETF